MTAPLPCAISDWLERTLGDLSQYDDLPVWEVVALAQETEMRHELAWCMSMRQRGVGGWEGKRARVQELQRRLSSEAKEERRRFWRGALG